MTGRERTGIGNARAARRGDTLPYDYRLLPRQRVAMIRAHGEVTDEELLDFLARLARDPAFAPDFSSLMDYSEASDFRLTPEGVRRAAEAAPFSSGSRRAFVVSSDYAHGMIRMFKAVSDIADERFGLFRDAESARAWLGLKERPRRG